MAAHLVLSRIWPRLGHDERVLFEIIERSGEIEAGEICHEYMEAMSVRGKKPAEQVTCRKYLQGMVRMGVITAMGMGRWRRYREFSLSLSVVTHGPFAGEPLYQQAQVN